MVRFLLGIQKDIVLVRVADETLVVILWNV
jgi:flagellar biogenesis protein FliO